MGCEGNGGLGVNGGWEEEREGLETGDLGRRRRRKGVGWDGGGGVGGGGLHIEKTTAAS